MSTILGIVKLVFAVSVALALLALAGLLSLGAEGGFFGATKALGYSLTLFVTLCTAIAASMLVIVGTVLEKLFCSSGDEPADMDSSNFTGLDAIQKLRGHSDPNGRDPLGLLDDLRQD